MLVEPLKTATHSPLPPKILVPWLTHHQGLLSTKLEMITGNTRLQVLKQQQSIANWWDQHFLHIRDRPVVHREIVMWAHDIACWYARTIIPESTYLHKPNFLSDLHGHSLGELLVADKSIQRMTLHYYAIDKKNIEFYWVRRWNSLHTHKLWVRLSTYSIGKQSRFFLLEIFLPGLMRYLPCN